MLFQHVVIPQKREEKIQYVLDSFLEESVVSDAVCFIVFIPLTSSLYNELLYIYFYFYGIVISYL